MVVANDEHAYSITDPDVIKSMREKANKRLSMQMLGSGIPDHVSRDGVLQLDIQNKSMNEVCAEIETSNKLCFVVHKGEDQSFSLSHLATAAAIRFKHHCRMRFYNKEMSAFEIDFLDGRHATVVKKRFAPLLSKACDALSALHPEQNFHMHQETMPSLSMMV